MASPPSFPGSPFPAEADPDWAGRTAAMLLRLVPAARLALCHLCAAGPPETAVRTADGAAPPDCLDALRSDVSRLEGAEGTVHLAPALGTVFGLRCLATLLRDEQGPWAFLVLGASQNSSPATVVLAETVLTVCAPFLSLGRHYEYVRRERDEFAAFALAGQATVGLAHELNNLLNGMVLQASVAQLHADEKFHAALDVIRRQAHQATALLQPLGQSAAERSKTFYPVDLAYAVREVLRERPALAARVVLAPAPASLPSIRAAVSALKQLIHLLLSGVSAGTPAPLRVRVGSQGAGVELLVEAEGPADASGSHAEAVPWGGLGDLERLAGQSLLRQLQGALRVEPLPEGGVRLRVCWNGSAAPVNSATHVSSPPV